MKNNTLIRTNLLVCIIIIIGFSVVSLISYKSNFEMYEKDIEMVSNLSSEGLFHEISTIFAQPVSVSLTMANDSLLKSFLENEAENVQNPVWQEQMREYLDAYRKKYGFSSVFLVSTTTENYYHYQGINRVLSLGEAEDEWYYQFLKGNEEYALNVDNDQATDDSITVFLNCKIMDEGGKVLGVVGVGLEVDTLQEILARYESEFGVNVYMVDGRGMIELSSSVTGYEKQNLFEGASYEAHKDTILGNHSTEEHFWYNHDQMDGYVVSRYEPNLKWHLIVENDTSLATAQLNGALVRNVVVILLIVGLVIFIITTVIRRYNLRISELIVSQELEYQRLLHEMTVGLYENIFQLDITHNCAGSDETRRYFESLGISGDASYEEALGIIARKQIKAEFVEGYLAGFSPEAVMEAYKEGITNRSYDFMISSDGVNYRWIRITARIFYWNSDGSIRMITYRENIDAEKRRELQLLESIQRDSMTGLYNKRATEELAQAVLRQSPVEGAHHIFLIFDIDNFKSVNDTMGHSFGDHVINEVAAAIKSQFREEDIVGRVGGDEFTVLIKNMGDMDGLRQKLGRLYERIKEKDFGEEEPFHVTCSIGVSLFPEHGDSYEALYEKADSALYHAKSHGKNSFSIYGEYGERYTFHANSRDMELLLNAAADGLAQYAYTDPIKLLYFNPGSVELFGITSETLTSPNFDPMAVLHPDDIPQVLASLEAGAAQRKAFSCRFRIRRQVDGCYVAVEVKAAFISELYENKYPVFYVMYFKRDDLEFPPPSTPIE